MGRQSKFEHHKGAVLEAIDALTRREGKAPSMRQVAVETGISVATLHAYLKKLREQGLIQWIEGKHRSLSVSPGALTATGPGHTPPSPSASSLAPAPAPTTPPVAPPPAPTPQPVPVPAAVAPRQVDESIDVGF